jgi:hypothetical protein
MVSGFILQNTVKAMFTILYNGIPSIGVAASEGLVADVN